MTAISVKREQLHEIDQRKKRAWSSYAGSLIELNGKEYEEAEARSWNRLQKKLKELEKHRLKLEEIRTPSKASKT